MHNRLGIARLAVGIAVIPLTLQGCGRIGAMSRVDPLTVAVYPGGKNPAELPKPGTASTAATTRCDLVRGAGGYFAGAIDLDCFQFPEDRNVPKDAVLAGTANNGVPQNEPNCPAPAGFTAYARAVGCVRERNRLTALLLKASDDICVREMGSLTADQATVNATLNILSTAVTATANIVTGEQAKSILTGAGTLATASRSHINADVYRNTVSYAVSRAIILERKRLRDQIEARYGQLTTTFTVDDAIRAANEYHGVCSFYRGLELVLASVEGDQRTRDAQMRRERIEDLERQITRYRSLLAGIKKNSGEDPKIYTDKIDELASQIQALTLADMPATDEPKKGEDGTGAAATTK